MNCLCLGEVSGGWSCRVVGMVGGSAYACKFAWGKRVMVCLVNWQACRMPGMRVCWRQSWWM
jgi:hypothetical protein